MTRGVRASSSSTCTCVGESRGREPQKGPAGAMQQPVPEPWDKVRKSGKQVEQGGQASWRGWGWLITTKVVMMAVVAQVWEAMPAGWKGKED